MKHLTLTLTALAALASSGYAKPAAKPAKIVVKCPVTGEKIANPAKASGGKSVYKGKAYAFCCPGCKPKFDKSPAKYVKNSAKGIYEKM